MFFSCLPFSISFGKKGITFTDGRFIAAKKYGLVCGIFQYESGFILMPGIGLIQLSFLTVL